TTPTPTASRRATCAVPKPGGHYLSPRRDRTRPAPPVRARRPRRTLERGPRHGACSTAGMKSPELADLELTRREVVRLLGSFAAAGMLGCAGAGAREASESPTT